MSSLITGIILAVIVVTAIGVSYRSRWLVVVVPSVLLGGLSYFVISIYAARAIGAGHFYSFPFGGYSVRDSNIVASTLFWVAAWATALHLVMPRWKHNEKEEGGGRPGRKEIAVRVLLSILPLGLTPLLGWLISCGYLNFGGGCKDIVMIFPWLVWSLAYFVFFVSLTIKKAGLKKTVIWSVAGATAVTGVVFAAMFVWSFAGIG